MLPGFAVCVDATHPYAAEASGNIRAACLAAGVPPEAAAARASALPPDSVVVPAPAAARWVAGTQGTSCRRRARRELAAFGAGRGAAVPAGAAHARGACGLRGGGRAPRQYHWLQGPFTRELNEALMRRFDIGYLVTKTAAHREDSAKRRRRRGMWARGSW